MKNFLKILLVLSIAFLNAIAQTPAWIPTTSNDGLYFIGNVGIGTPTPSSFFNVRNGNILIQRSMGSGLSDDPVLFIGSKPGGYMSLTPSYSGKIGIGTSQPIADFNIKQRTFLISNNSNEPILFTKFQTMIGSHNIGGSVGIGTLIPTAKLEISASGYLTQKNLLLKLSNVYSSAGANQPTIQFNNGVYSAGVASVYWNMGAVVASGSNGNSKFSISYKEGSNAEKELFRIASTGTVYCEQMKVKLSADWPWADYVFDKDYNLMSIADLKKFITVNGHLPEIPNADEMNCEGLDVAQMNTLLLKKVEEFSLYIIDLQKQIDNLKSEIK